VKLFYVFLAYVFFFLVFFSFKTIVSGYVKKEIRNRGERFLNFPHGNAGESAMDFVVISPTPSPSQRRANTKFRLHSLPSRASFYRRPPPMMTSRRKYEHAREPITSRSFCDCENSSIFLTQIAVVDFQAFTDLMINQYFF